MCRLRLIFKVSINWSRLMHERHTRANPSIFHPLLYVLSIFCIEKTPVTFAKMWSWLSLFQNWKLRNLVSFPPFLSFFLSFALALFILIKISFVKESFEQIFGDWEHNISSTFSSNSNSVNHYIYFKNLKENLLKLSIKVNNLQGTSYI